MRKKNSVTIVLFIFSLLLSGLTLVKSDTTYASNVKKCFINVGCYKIFTVNTEDDIKWNVSGNHCVKIWGSRNNKKVMVIARKVGKAKITAKYGDRKKSWIVTVKKNSTSHLSLKKTTVTQGKAVIQTVAHIVSGDKKLKFEYGKGYKLYRYTEKKWKRVKFSDHYAFNANVAGVYLKKNAKAKVNLKYTLKISNFKNWNMESGLYKLVADTTLPTGKEYVLFEL